MTGQQRLQDLAANRRELPRPHSANPLRMLDGVRGAAAVVVIGRGKGRSRQSHPIKAIKKVGLRVWPVDSAVKIGSARLFSILANRSQITAASFGPEPCACGRSGFSLLAVRNS